MVYKLLWHLFYRCVRVFSLLRRVRQEKFSTRVHSKDNISWHLQSLLSAVCIVPVAYIVQPRPILLMPLREARSSENESDLFNRPTDPLSSFTWPVCLLSQLWPRTWTCTRDACPADSAIEGLSRRAPRFNHQTRRHHHHLAPTHPTNLCSSNDMKNDVHS